MKKLSLIVLLCSSLFATEQANKPKTNVPIPPLSAEEALKQKTPQQKQDVSVENLVKILNATEEKTGIPNQQLPPKVALETQNLKLAAIGFSEINGVKKALILDGTSPVYVKIGDIYKGLKINNITKDCIFVGEGSERLYYISRNDIKYIDSKSSK